ncbi:MAG: NADH-quinone oxidoreductase subunit C [Collinsella sp.]
MIETENKVYARRCESHVEALRAAVPGAIEKVEWQCEDQLTITVSRTSCPRPSTTCTTSATAGFPRSSATMSAACAAATPCTTSSPWREDPGWVTVRTEVDPAKMTFPSVTPFVPACVWGERELRDMFGLIPEGLPDRRRLVLPDDWPSGLYPLRKDSMDYRFRPAPASDMENYEFLADTKGKETTLVPMGPLHITSDEPGHFRLFVEGETIVDADYRLFYVHRGMEKVAETRLNYDAVTFLADRICGICGCAHSVAYAEAVERAQGIVSRRAPSTSAPSCSRSSACTRICSTLAWRRTTRASTPASSSSSASARSPWTWPRSSPVTARPTAST